MNTDELKKLAEAASPGPWWLYERDKDGNSVVSDPNNERQVKRWIDCNNKRDAAFIAAANPATVLELIAERDELLEVLKAVADEFAFGQLTEDSIRVIYDKVRFTYAKFAKAKGGAA